MPHKKTIFFLLLYNYFFKIENCCGTLNWPLILSLYQKNTIKICYFQYLCSSVKKTDKKIICEDQEHISNNRGCYLKVRL